MSDTKYIPDLQKEIPDLEIVKLRKEVAELKQKLAIATEILEENDLLDSIHKEMTPQELICHQQIDKYAELSDKGVPFTIEDIKSFEILVKTLLAIQGKVVVPEEKKHKKKPEVSVSELISIVKGTKQ